MKKLLTWFTLNNILWLIMVVITIWLWTFGMAHAETPNFDGTIGLVVSGNYKDEVQQFVWQALKENNYNVILLDYKNTSASYKILEVEVKKISGQTSNGNSYTPDYIPSFNLKIGNYSQSIDINSSSNKNIATHSDKMSVKMTIWQGNNALSSSQSVIPVVWREISTSNSYNNQRGSEEYLLLQGALQAAGQAFNQLALSSPSATHQSSDNNNFDAVVLFLLRKDEYGTWGRRGVGKTPDEAFQNALKAEEKLLPPKK